MGEIFSERELETDRHFKNPEPGDTFHEFYSVTLTVVDVGPLGVLDLTTTSAHHSFAHHGKNVFAEHHMYRSSNLKDRYPWDYLKRDTPIDMDWEEHRFANNLLFAKSSLIDKEFRILYYGPNGYESASEVFPANTYLIMDVHGLSIAKTSQEKKQIISLKKLAYA